ncbi:hypothetical protein ACSBR1_007988 [Camellia fascicularis]
MLRNNPNRALSQTQSLRPKLPPRWLKKPSRITHFASQSQHIERFPKHRIQIDSIEVEIEEKTEKKSKNKTTQFMKTNDFDDYYDWFTSDDDDDDKTTLFSSKSLSSDSSDLFHRNEVWYGANRRNRGSKKKGSEEMGLMPLEGKVKNSFAIVKRSSDPYSDFRTLMVEMIVEKQIFGARDLENLLQTFLSLNLYHHHKRFGTAFVVRNHLQRLLRKCRSTPIQYHRREIVRSVASPPLTSLRSWFAIVCNVCFDDVLRCFTMMFYDVDDVELDVVDGDDVVDVADVRKGGKSKKGL